VNDIGNKIKKKKRHLMRVNDLEKEKERKTLRERINER
jgi:hypothetical protein